MKNGMAGRTLLALAGACLSWLLMVPALAAGLYPDGTLRDMARGHRIEAGDTMAGYPIYPGHNGWFFEDAKSDLAIGLNGEIFGFRDMVPGDWNEAALKAHPRRKAFFDRLTQWALQFEQAVDKAFRKEAGVDAYADLPSYMTLAPVIEDLRDESPSLTFLGAVADLSNKPDHSAIAYSPTGKGTTRWGNSWGLPTPADAQERALAACERERPSSAPPCKVYMGKRLP